MEPEILYGKPVADSIVDRIKERVDNLKAQGRKVPGLEVILVGQNPASQAYVRMKGKACEKIGFTSVQTNLPADVSEQELLATIEKANKNPDIHGILLQLPIPKGLDENKMIEAIDPAKDVDVFHPVNVGKMLIGLDGLKPCTPDGVVEMLLHYGIKPEGKHVVIIGRSNIVGKALAAILVQKSPRANATITVCHSRTKNLKELTLQADILIAAIGSPKMVKADMVKPGAVVVDVGINRVDDETSPKGYKLVGDVDFEDVMAKCSAITPVPKGVGPLTIAMLMKNTFAAFCNSTGLDTPV